MPIAPLSSPWHWGLGIQFLTGRTTAAHRARTSQGRPRMGTFVAVVRESGLGIWCMKDRWGTYLGEIELEDLLDAEIFLWNIVCRRPKVLVIIKDVDYSWCPLQQWLAHRPRVARTLHTGRQCGHVRPLVRYHARLSGSLPTRLVLIQSILLAKTIDPIVVLLSLSTLVGCQLSR